MPGILSRAREGEGSGGACDELSLYHEAISIAWEGADLEGDEDPPWTAFITSTSLGAGTFCAITLYTYSSPTACR
jgi:hypothetical protein